MPIGGKGDQLLPKSPRETEPRTVQSRVALRRLETRVFALRGIARIYAWVPARAEGARHLLLSEGYSVVCERLPSRAMLLQKMRSPPYLELVVQPERTSTTLCVASTSS